MDTTEGLARGNRAHHSTVAQLKMVSGATGATGSSVRVFKWTVNMRNMSGSLQARQSYCHLLRKDGNGSTVHEVMPSLLAEGYSPKAEA